MERTTDGTSLEAEAQLALSAGIFRRECEDTAKQMVREFCYFSDEKELQDCELMVKYAEQLEMIIRQK